MTGMSLWMGLQSQEAYIFSPESLPSFRGSDTVLDMEDTAPAEPGPTTAGPEHWLNVEEAAEFFRTSPKTLYRLTSKRLIPYRQLPGTASKAFAPEDLRDIAEMSLWSPRPSSP